MGFVGILVLFDDVSYLLVVTVIDEHICDFFYILLCG
jgi:hypothetical protein